MTHAEADRLFYDLPVRPGYGASALSLPVGLGLSVSDTDVSYPHQVVACMARLGSRLRSMALSTRAEFVNSSLSGDACQVHVGGGRGAFPVTLPWQPPSSFSSFRPASRTSSRLLGSRPVTTTTAEGSVGAGAYGPTRSIRGPMIRTSCRLPRGSWRGIRQLKRSRRPTPGVLREAQVPHRGRLVILSPPC